MAMSMTPEAFASTNFDFLIAGGGTAGLVVANRLSEIPTINVGVIEAGISHQDDENITIPVNMFRLQGNPKYDYGFVSEPQADLYGKAVPQARGKGLGGSSAINFMQFTFASQADFNDWATLGNPGWDYAGIEQYYKKMENYQGIPAELKDAELDGQITDPKVHGAGGPINSSIPAYQLPVQEAWLPTLEEMGLMASPGDPRDGISIGAHNNPMTSTRNGSIRSYAANSYLFPFASRPNLHFITEAVVSNIMFASNTTKGSNLTATGLNFTVNGKNYIANASREVILAGGTMNSPQMLELSGIGNRSILEPLGIKVLYENNNVGENLQDHPQNVMNYVLINGSVTQDDVVNETLYKKWDDIYKVNGSGLFASGISNTAQLSWPQIVSYRTQNLTGRPQQLVDKYYNATYRNSLSPGIRAQYDLVTKRLVDPKEQAVQISIAAINGHYPGPGEDHIAGSGGFVCHALSRGYIHINSTDPTAKAPFNPRYLSHMLDYEMLKDVMYFSLNVSSRSPMKDQFQHISDGQPLMHPNDFQLNPTTEDHFVRYNMSTGWHIVGSVPMLPENMGGVVSPRLRVYGTSNVRVIDASIVPLHVRGNTVSLTYAISEKGADLIKQDYGFATDNSTLDGSKGTPIAAGFNGTAGLGAAQYFYVDGNMQPTLTGPGNFSSQPTYAPKEGGGNGYGAQGGNGTYTGIAIGNETTPTMTGSASAGKQSSEAVALLGSSKSGFYSLLACGFMAVGLVMGGFL